MSNIIKLSWDCDKPSDAYTVYRSKQPFDLENLPDPIAINVINNYHTFIEQDTDLTYYLVSNGTFYSEPFKSEGKPT